MLETGPLGNCLGAVVTFRLPACRLAGWFPGSMGIRSVLISDGECDVTVCFG